MLDALQLLASRGIRFFPVERSSERSGASGHVLSLGKWHPVMPASGASSPTNPLASASPNSFPGFEAAGEDIHESRR